MVDQSQTSLQHSEIKLKLGKKLNYTGLQDYVYKETLVNTFVLCSWRDLDILYVATHLRAVVFNRKQQSIVNM